MSARFAAKRPIRFAPGAKNTKRKSERGEPRACQILPLSRHGTKPAGNLAYLEFHLDSRILRQLEPLARAAHLGIFETCVDLLQEELSHRGA
jgi:hypothetical protein